MADGDSRVQVTGAGPHRASPEAHSWITDIARDLYMFEAILVNESAQLGKVSNILAVFVRFSHTPRER